MLSQSGRRQTSQIIIGIRRLDAPAVDLREQGSVCRVCIGRSSCIGIRELRLIASRVIIHRHCRAIRLDTTRLTIGEISVRHFSDRISSLDDISPRIGSLGVAMPRGRRRDGTISVGIRS